MPKANANSASALTPKRDLAADMRFVKVVAKRAGECFECDTHIFPGDRIVWDKQHHNAYCEGCGEDLEN